MFMRNAVKGNFGTPIRSGQVPLEISLRLHTIVLSVVAMTLSIAIGLLVGARLDFLYGSVSAEVALSFYLFRWNCL